MNAFRRSITALSVVAASLVYVAASPAAPAFAAMTIDIAGMTVTPVLTGLPSTPVAAKFSPDGRIYIALKEGKVLMYDGPGDTTPVTTLDIQTATQNYADRGMLGMALDPAFTSGRPYLYVLYTYDRDPFGTSTVPRWGDNCPTPPGGTTDGCTVSARLDRYSVNSSGVTTGSATRLLDGVGGSLGGWCNQFPSHAIGTLAFGADNMLYVGAGDGASYNYADYGQSGGSLSGTPTPANPCNDKQGTSSHTGGRGTALSASASRGGALRSQAVRGAFNNEYIAWDGSILRINPDTGAAATGNPLLNNGISGDDRIVAYGLRNPFRFNLKPGTNQLWLGDVGWNTYEEVDRFDAGPTQTTVPNFGWPCYEGPNKMGTYDGLNISLCETLYANNTSSLGGVSSPLVAPTYSWRRINNSGALPCSSSASGGGGAATGGSFVTNNQWPVALQGSYVFGDYARQCIALIPMVNGNPDTANVKSIVSGVFPVDIQNGPGGDVYWIDIATNALNRIRPVAGNLAPVASFTATPPSGPTPLNVAFNASGTTDPNQGEVLTYTWDLDGDNACDDGSGITINRTYSSAATINVKLCVADQLGATNTTTRQIQPGNTAPVITSFTSSADANGWKVGDNVTFGANATDNAGTLPASAYTWKLDLRHCASEAQTGCHTHPLTAPPAGKTGSFTGIDHEYYAYLQLTLTVTDNTGLTATQVKDLLPRVSTVTLQTTPPGINVSAGSVAGVSPLTTKFLENGAAQLVAPATAVVGGVTQTFVAWADNASVGATRTINAPAGATTYTAMYDGQAPGVVNVVANPANLDLRTGSSVVVAANLTDDIGVVSAVAALSGPNGTVFDSAMTRTGGSPTSGPWSATLSLPNGAPAGTYNVTVSATDGVGKTGTGTGESVVVTHSSAPSIDAITTSADANGWKPGDAVTFDATVSDNQGALPASAYVWSLMLDDTPLPPPPNGSNGSFTAPAAAAGSVLVLSLAVTDGEGLSDTESVTLQRTPDTKPPAVVSATASPTRLDSRNDGTITVTAALTDDDTGVASAVAHVVGADLVVHSAPLSQQPDGTWTGDVELPLNSPPGDYAVTVEVTDAAGNARIASAGSVLVVWTLVEPPLPPGDDVGFGAITPRRVLDTRDGTGAPAARLSPGSVLRLEIAGTPGIDPNATGVVVNVAAVDAGGAGYVTVYSCGAVPAVSNLNLHADQTSANLAVVDLDETGAICFVGSQATDLVADVTAVIAAGGDGYSGISPVRIVDTRIGTGLAALPLEPGEIVEIPFAAASIPATASGVVANLTVTEPDAAGYLTAFPCGGDAPLASNVNFRAGQTVSNLILTDLDADQHLCVTTNATIDLVVDVSGWLTPDGGSPTVVTPFRALDTRTTVSVTAGQTLHLGAAGLGLPADASAVVANVTAVDPLAAGFLTVAPCEAAAAATSNVNFGAGETRPVLTMTTLGPSRTVCVHASQPMDVVIDVQGHIVG